MIRCIMSNGKMPEVFVNLLYVQPTHLHGEFDVMQLPGLLRVEGKTITIKHPPASGQVLNILSDDILGYINTYNTLSVQEGVFFYLRFPIFAKL